MNIDEKFMHKKYTIYVPTFGEGWICIKSFSIVISYSDELLLKYNDIMIDCIYGIAPCNDIWLFVFCN